MDNEDVKKIIQKKIESINIFHTKVNLDKITSYCKDRISTFEQILDEIQGFYILEKNEEIRNFDYKNLFQLWIKELGRVEDLNKEIIDDIIMISKNELDIYGKNLFIPLRIALISKTHGPDIFTLINILGIEESIKRLKRFD